MYYVIYMVLYTNEYVKADSFLLSAAGNYLVLSETAGLS